MPSPGAHPRDNVTSQYALLLILREDFKDRVNDSFTCGFGITESLSATKYWN
jgi:hypothetical protein